MMNLRQLSTLTPGAVVQAVVAGEKRPRPSLPGNDQQGFSRSRLREREQSSP